MHLKLNDLAQKKFWRPFFFENFDILFSKAETARADASGQKKQIATPHFSDPIPKSEAKFYLLFFTPFIDERINCNFFYSRFNIFSP